MAMNSRVPFYGTLSARTLAKARNCAKIPKMKALSLRTPASQVKVAEAVIIDKVCQKMIAGEEIGKEFLMDTMDSLVSEEAFRAVQGYLNWREAFPLKIMRMVNYVASLNWELEAGQNFEVSYPHPVGTASFAFDKIVQKAQLIGKDADGRTHLVAITSHELPYSYRARKDVNRVPASLELLTLKAGSFKIYPGAVCEIWSLNHKDDKAGELAPSFEDGKTCFSEAFESFNNEGAELVANELLRCAGLADIALKCEECVYRSACQMQTSVRVDASTDTASEVSTQGKAVKEEAVGHAAKLTLAQKEVVNFMEGAMNVIAVPGAGKTFALVERVRNMVLNGIDPKNILLVTFTKKAAEEIKERIKWVLPDTPADELPTVMTYNGFGSFILSKNKRILGREYRLATKPMCLDLILEIINTKGVPVVKGVSYNGAESKYGIVSILYKHFQFIDENGKSDFATAYESKCDTAAVIALYDLYKAEWDDRGYITYDDQITLVNKLFEENPRVVALMSKIFTYIMVDEYQDTNAEQAKLIYTLAHEHGNIVVVGDDDQAIYAWRGGDSKFLLDFPKEFEGATTVRMCDNFRSNGNILRACNRLVSDTEKAFIPHKEQAVKPLLLKGYPQKNIAGLVKYAISKGYKPRDIAVLFRKNRTGCEIQEDLSLLGIKSVSPKDYLVDDGLFLAIRDVLMLADGKYEDLALFRTLRILGVKEEELTKVYKNSSLIENLNLLQIINADSLDASVGTYIKRKENSSTPELDKVLYKLIKLLVKVRYASDATEVTRTIAFDLFGITSHPALSHIGQIIEESGCDDVLELLKVMNCMITFGDDTRIMYTASEEFVNLLTAHDSKGKEFPFVIVANCEDYDETEEDKHLLYVAMSRARENLVLTCYTQTPLIELLSGEMEVRGYGN